MLIKEVISKASQFVIPASLPAVFREGLESGRAEQDRLQAIILSGVCE